MLSEQVQYQGKAGFFKLNFLFLSKYEAGFCSDSHIYQYAKMLLIYIANVMFVQ